MYLEHYGLTEAPFRITPHTDFFFAGAKRGATLDALLYAINNDEGIAKVSGEVGSGKTMVCRMLMERLPDRVVAIYLASPSLSGEDILYAIADELGIGAAAMRASAVLRNLQEHLIKLHGEGRQVVVLIDEAHAMSIETLEEIRLLSNLESNHHNLLQLVLFGQPELNHILARPDMRQLKERITHNFTLEPLTLADIAAYLAFRMRAAGYRGPDIFSGTAIKLIASASQGYTRRINILADKSLLAAFAENTHQVTRRHVRSVIRSSDFDPDRQSRVRIWARLAGFSLAALFLVTILLVIWPKTRTPVALSVVPALAAPMPSPAVRPAPTPAKPPPPPPAASPIVPAPAKIAVPPTAVPSATPAAADSASPAPPALTGKLAKLGSQTRARIEATRSWLANVPDQHWFIQLLTADAGNAEEIENFVAATVQATGGEDQVRVYVADIRGNPRIGVIYGDYPSREAALSALQQLPASLRALKPFPRMVKWLR